MIVCGVVPEGEALTQSSGEDQATFCATLVDEWARAGVAHAVVAPGSRSTPLALALVACPDIAVHVHVDERCAGFMGLGIGAATGRPAVVVTTSGTAAVELHPAVVEADLAGVPLICATADRPPLLQGVGAPQTIDQRGLYGSSVRAYVEPGLARDLDRASWRSIASRVYLDATQPRPGPVQLNLAFEEPLDGRPGPLPIARTGGPWHRMWVDSRHGGDDAGRLAALLGERRGVIVAGRGAPGVTEQLAEALGWPLLADPLSGLAGPSVVAAFDPILRSPLAEELRPEVVVRVGDPVASRVTNEWIASSGAPEVLLGPVGSSWADPSRRVDLVIASGDLTGLLEDTCGVLGDDPDPEWRERWVRIEAQAQDAIDSVLASDELCEPAIARWLAAMLPAGARLIVSSSMPVRDLEWFARRRADLTVMANRGANGIDGVVSTAVGAVTASGVPTAVLVGDLAFLHDSNALIGLAYRDLDLLIVVVDNDGGGIFSFLPQASSTEEAVFEQVLGTPTGMDPAAVARGFSVRATTVTDRADLVDACAGEGLRVVVVSGDRKENVAMHARLNEAVAEAIRDC